MSTPITEVQGDGFRSPFEGRRVSLRGTVTHLQPGEGFFLEDGSLTAGPASRAIFVAMTDREMPDVGWQVVVQGRVEERGESRDTLTALSADALSPSCDRAAMLPITGATLPLDTGQREALEGMRVRFGADFELADVYNAHRGQWTLAFGGPLRIPTEIAAPGAAAAGIARENAARSLAVQLPGNEFPARPVGARGQGLLGVLGHDGRGPRLLLEELPAVETRGAPGAPPPASGALRLVGMNLLNYFNGNGRGGGFPTERGARTAEEFAAQRSRLGAALAQLQPDLLAVQELENDGFGADSAARSLIGLLEESTGGGWSVIEPANGPIGGDVITVGLFFRPDRLLPVGPAETLDSTPFIGLSRQPLAQRFREPSGNGSLWVAVNHLKSKGRCPETGPNRDQDDGQGCWNPARVAAVRELTGWLQALMARSDTHRALVIGDMNAWRQEDPIVAFQQAGYEDLVALLSGLPQYSYLYFGQRGTLDYAFATPTLIPWARKAFIWHINAAMPRGQALAQPWLRASDHDPVVVDLDFSQASTSD